MMDVSSLQGDADRILSFLHGGGGKPNMTSEPIQANVLGSHRSPTCACLVVQDVLNVGGRFMCSEAYVHVTIL